MKNRIRRYVELPWIELSASVCCFHFALGSAHVIFSAFYAGVGAALLVTAISELTGQRKATHS
jgi:hypothetical protein